MESPIPLAFEGIKFTMTREERPRTVRPLFEMGLEQPPIQEVKQDIVDRKGEAKRVIKRLYAIFEDHREAAVSLKIDLGPKDLSYVLEALRAHAKGGGGLPVQGSRDEIHAYCLDRLFEELVEEPSNILFTTKTGSDKMRYDAMNAEFWIECLDLMEATFSSRKDS